MPMKEYSIKSIIDEVLFASFPEAFNDPYDVCFSYNIGYIYKIIMQSNKLANYFFHKYCQKYIGYYENYKSYKEYEAASETVWHDFMEEKYKAGILNAIQEEIDKILYYLKNKNIIACFSKNSINETMWAHYASQGKGLVVEYKIQEINNVVRSYLNKIEFTTLSTECKKIFGLHPVEYSEQKFDGTDFVIRKLKEKSLKKNKHSDPDVFNLETFTQHCIQPKTDIFAGLMLTKNKTWEYEQEYRLVLPYYGSDMLFLEEMIKNMKRNSYILIGHIKPTAIYMGEFIDESNMINLCYISKAKGIPLYKMTTSYSINNFGLMPVLLNKEKIELYLSSKIQTQ